MDRRARIVARARNGWVVALLLAVLLVFILASVFLRSWLAPWVTDPVAVRRLIREFGVWGPLAFVGLQAAQVILAPIPGQALGVASGYLFGVFWGTVVSLLGAAIGSYVAIVLARRYGRPFVARSISSEWLTRFDEFSTRRGYLTLFLVFLIPGLPDDVICFVAGLSTLDVRKMVGVSIAGRFPGYVLLNLAGERLASSRPEEGLVLLGVVVVITAIAYLFRDRVHDIVLGSS